jgi:hypothetical protein
VTEQAKAVEQNASATSDRRNIGELSIRNQSFLFLTPPISPPGRDGPASACVKKIPVWQEQDEMRQRAIGSKVIPRKFRDEKEALLPHCGREH